MTELTKQIQGRLDPDRRAKMIYVGHQANLTMLEAVVRRCDVPADRHFFNIDRFGNQAAAGAPAVISQSWDRFQAGDVVACVVVGSGLSWAGVQLEWT
jgi:3-oxoacyl-[acyl-carrier-protein] synthase-3